MTKGFSYPKHLGFVILTLTVFLGFLFIQSMVSGGNAFSGGYWRRQGWWFFAYLGVLFYLVATAELDRVFIMRSIRVILFAVAGLGLLFLPGPLRFAGTFGEANSWGVFAALSLVSVFESKKYRILSFFPLVALLLSQSRSALVAVALPFISSVRWYVKLPIILLSIIFIMWFNIVRGSGERLEVWSASFSIWQSAPWLGIGLDNFQSVFTDYMQNRGLQWQYYDHPHNLIIWSIVSMGTVGFGLFIGWLSSVFSFVGESYFKKLSLILLIFGFFQPFSTAVWVFLVIFLALSKWQPEDKNTANLVLRDFSYRRLWTFVLGALTGLLIVGRMIGFYLSPFD
ncbi:MAG: O-antigen polymerase [Microgenomates group bacterium GW2011_GWA2_44_7]|nr:MAG: O-antigen polymerase [Microgenomates group bacterium GW2011_GWA2_44_7]